MVCERDASQGNWDHTLVWQQQCRSRLLENPLDLDALFAKAAWLAKSAEYEKCIETLDVIAKKDPFYPGVWMLKSKTYSLLGNGKMARSRSAETAMTAASVLVGRHLDRFDSPLNSRSVSSRTYAPAPMKYIPTKRSGTVRENLPPREVVESVAQAQMAPDHREERNRETGEEDGEAEGQRVGVVDPPPQDGAVAPSSQEHHRQSCEEPRGWIVVLELVRPALADRPCTVRLLC